MQGPFLGGFNPRASSRLTPSLYQIRSWPMQSRNIKGTLFLFYQMIVQIKSQHTLCLFERNLKAVVTFGLPVKPMCDFFFFLSLSFKPCVNMVSFTKIKISAFPGLQEEGQVKDCSRSMSQNKTVHDMCHRMYAAWMYLSCLFSF